MLAGVYRECLELSCRERLGPSLVQIIKSRGVVRCLLFSCYSVLKSRGVPPQSKNRTSKVGRSTPASILFSKQNKRRIGEIVVQNLPPASGQRPIPCPWPAPSKITCPPSREVKLLLGTAFQPSPKLKMRLK